MNNKEKEDVEEIKKDIKTLKEKIIDEEEIKKEKKFNKSLISIAISSIILGATLYYAYIILKSEIGSYTGLISTTLPYTNQILFTTKIIIYLCIATFVLTLIILTFKKLQKK